MMEAKARAALFGARQGRLPTRGKRAGGSIAGLTVLLALLASPATVHAGGTAAPVAQSCSSISVSAGGVMSARCPNYFGTVAAVTLVDAPRCPQTLVGASHGEVWNVDGALRCVFAHHPSASGADTFDIIGRLEDSKTAAGETIVWRVDHPDVTSALKGYPLIQFKAGDLVSIQAGGCVQTGGSGRTWKSYTNPLGGSANKFYSGTIWIPAVLGSNTEPGERIAGVLGKQWIVPLDAPPTLNGSLMLNLGYQDDQLDDNGYGAHDDGNDDQCKGVGPAFVMVRIDRDPGLASNEPALSPGSKPFDLVWDMRRGVDPNGLPLNPTWNAEARGAKTAPDFLGACGGAFTQSGPFGEHWTINEGFLAARCTSQAPTTDLSTNSFDEAFGICNDGPNSPPNAGKVPSADTTFVVGGHVNWTLATFTGAISWDEFSGGWPHDSDLNLHLQTQGDPALTASETSLALEFNEPETIDRLTSPFWRQTLKTHDAKTIAAAINGKEAVVIGLVGIDGVHGDGQTEVHPVLALAIRRSVTETPESVDEDWVWFLRKTGNEGECSSLDHTWPGLAGVYFMPFPWPEGANGVQATASSFAQDDGANGHASHGLFPGWTFMRLDLPNDGALVDGEFQIHYTRAAGHKAPAKHDVVIRPEPSEEPELSLAEISDRVADPAIRARLKADIQRADPTPPAPAAKRVVVAVDTTFTSYNPDRAAGRAGVITRTTEKPNALKVRATTNLTPLIDRYRAVFVPTIRPVASAEPAPATP